MAPVSEKRMILEYEETMGVAQLLRDDIRIGQSELHERNGQSVDIQAEVNRCQIENTNGGPHTKRGGGKASNIIHLCEGKTNEGGGDKTDDLYSSRLSTLDTNKPVKKTRYSGGKYY